MESIEGLRRTISYWPTEQIKVLELFLSDEGKIFTYEDVAKQLGISLKDIAEATGKSIGGILSALRRNKLNNEPFIVPLGRVLGTRRLQWKLNNKVFAGETREQTLALVDEVLRERK